MTYATAERRRADARARPGGVARSRSSSSARTAAGFFNVNSAMPFENPTGFSNFVEVLFILRHPGRAHGHLRPHGRQPPPGLGAVRGDARDAGRRHRGRRTARSRTARPRSTRPTSAGRQPAGQGAALRHRGERRPGRRSRPPRRTASVNSGHEAYTGAGGASSRSSNMMTGEVIFGGAGSGLYGMLLFVLLAVFIGGLMVGRTPEYLGKKIEAREVKLTLIGALYPALAVLVLTGLAVGHEVRRSRRSSAPGRRASRRRCTRTRRRATTTARRSPATPASCSRTRPATRAPSGSRSPT